MNSVTTAYSYIRFSSERQILGDSLRRQVESAEKFALDRNLVLDTHSFRDLGVSAYRERNAVEGKLATFLRAVDGGFIPPQSYLLIESLDRLSRDEVDEALELFLSIIRRGIVIVTLCDHHEYSRATIKLDHGISLIVSITVMMRAHEESALKSMRGKEVWRARTAKGGILTRICPSWLSWSGQKWEIDKKRLLR
jgi:DNA invertase Pin-like site-specific DNA recombinase